jgi:hypothetical protein
MPIYSDRLHGQEEHRNILWLPIQSYMPRVGDYIDPGSVGGYYVDSSVAGNYLYANLIVLQRRMRFDRIGCYVTAAATGVIRLGIYNVSPPPSLYPTSLIVDAGEADVSTIGSKELTINVTLGRGFYALAYISNTTPSLRGCLGGVSVLAWGSTSPDRPIRSSVQVSQAYGTLPSTFPTGAIGTDTRRMICLRVAELL